MKFNWKMFVAILLMILLIGCDKSTNEENDNTNETGKDNQGVEKNGDNNKKDHDRVNNKVSEAFSPEDFIEVLLDGNYSSIYNQMSETFQSQITIEELEDIAEDFNEGVDDYDVLTKIQVDDMMEYQWQSDDDSKGIRVYFADDNTIEGLEFIPVTANADSDDVWTENTYHMPFQGEWMTFWGGVNNLVNYHYDVVSQRYAYDLFIMEDGTSHEGSASENESYFAYGEPVLAPLEGKVTVLEDTIEDNTPTVDTNEEQPLGNHVTIEHENGEYSVIAHLKQGSVTVEEGDMVDAGDELGKVGNSGNSSEPHIHFQVSDSPEEGDLSSIRIQLEHGEDPVRGETVNGF